MGDATALPDRPGKVVAVHLNYRSRAAERGRTPDHPSYFLKPATSVAVGGGPLERPAGCRLLAFEGEVALVIGRTARRVTPAEAWDHVGSVTAANDLGVYDLRAPDRGSNVRSKGGDGFTPLGPDAIDAREVDLGALRLRTWVNGELRQDAAVADELLFGFDQLVADLSRLMTLEPGDVILTGTPTGSSVVEPGDVVEVEVTDGLRSSGRLRTEVTAAAEALPAYGAMPAAGPAEEAEAYGGAGRPPLAGLPDEVVAGLRSVSTATLASQLRKRGVPSAVLGHLAPVGPARRFAGRARTLRYLPLREDLAARNEGMTAQKRVIDSLRPGDVLVMDARGDTTAGTLGDILALRAQVLGAAGVITDGAVRDHEAIAALDLPVLAGGRHPAVLGRRHVAWDVDVPVACAGALVQPGDIVVADGDGAVVMGDALALEVVPAAVEQERQERFIAAQVAAGASVDGLYPLGPRWRPAYEAWLAEQDGAAPTPSPTHATTGGTP